MEAIRKIVKLKDNILKIELPDDYKNKTVELIILETDEVVSLVKEPESDYTKLYGSMNLGMSMTEIDKQLKDLRNEWERDIS